MRIPTVFVGLFAGDGFVAVEAGRVRCEAAVVRCAVLTRWGIRFNPVDLVIPVEVVISTGSTGFTRSTGSTWWGLSYP